MIFIAKTRKIKKKFLKKIKTLIIVIILAIIGVVAYQTGQYYTVYSEELIPIDEKKDYYNISDFGFVRVKSETDYDKDGQDDYTDIFGGEKQYAKWNPKYKSDYYAGGYPPVEKEGVCTDLVWYSLKEAGYNLKDMISYDIKTEEKAGRDTYDIKIVDDNIDFRRVINQEVFFQRYALELDPDIYNIGEFMPGDIITFDDSAHIAMISDKYNENGVPYVIQNRDETQKQKEEDRLEKIDMEVTGHYRFEYSEKLEKLISKVNKA